jgi:hypothetical protein
MLRRDRGGSRIQIGREQNLKMNDVIGGYSSHRFMNFLHGFVREVRINYGLFILLLPGLTWVFLFNYLPLPGVLLAFKNFKYVTGNFFVNMLK